MALTDVDRGLLNRCFAREPGAWKEFVDRFVALFAHVIQHTAHARSIQLQSTDLEDLCSEIFVVLLADDFAVLRRFRGQSSLASYLVVVARRTVVRQMIQRRMAEALGHVRAHGVEAESPGDDGLLRIENEEIVRKMLKELSPTDAEVVRQYHLEGRSYREISQQLKIPENSIGPLLSRAREQLRQGVTSAADS